MSANALAFLLRKKSLGTCQCLLLDPQCCCQSASHRAIRAAAVSECLMACLSTTHTPWQSDCCSGSYTVHTWLQASSRTQYYFVASLATAYGLAGPFKMERMQTLPCFNTQVIRVCQTDMVNQWLPVEGTRPLRSAVSFVSAGNAGAARLGCSAPLQRRRQVGVRSVGQREPGPTHLSEEQLWLGISSLRDLVATPLHLQKSILAKDMTKIVNAQQFQTTTGVQAMKPALPT